MLHQEPDLCSGTICPQGHRGHASAGSHAAGQWGLRALGRAQLTPL